MKFLLDESMELRIGRFLRSGGHDVTAIVRDYTRSIADTEVLSVAYAEQRILVTNDKDFTVLVFNEFRLHAGVILFRLGRGGTIEDKLRLLQYILEHHAGDLDSFITVYSDAITVRRTPAVASE